MAQGWSYQESLDWLYARQRLGIKLGLEKVYALLAAVGNPQQRFAAIHVAGTNGKGSVVRMLAEALRHSGLRTGFTTSPHLVQFTERITLDGKAIEPEVVARLLAQVRDAVPDLDEAGQPPTFFECVTALAFLAFAEAGIDWAVVETGMGGRLDATNTLEPRLCVITNVDRDHMAFLGEHVSEIAYEKAGIMKPGVPCVTAATGQALVVLKVVSHELRVPMSVIGEDYSIVPAPHLHLLRPTGESMYKVGLAGEHQHQNAAVVVACVDALRAQGVAIPERALAQALAHTTHPGRLESFQWSAAELGAAAQQRVEVLIDGAHNEAAAHSLRRHLGQRRWSGFHLVVGFNADKEWEKALEQWVPLAAHVWGVPLRNPRSLEPERMRRAVEGVGIPFAACPDARSALVAAASAGAQRVVVAGSIYLAGEARATLVGQPLEEIRGSQ
jgi:dihydrofolate synthase / folylpolyglutamate synthase